MSTKTNAEIRAETPEKWRVMIPDPHPPSNCGPLQFDLPPGVRCPTCGLDPEQDKPTPASPRLIPLLAEAAARRDDPAPVDDLDRIRAKYGRNET